MKPISTESLSPPPLAASAAPPATSPRGSSPPRQSPAGAHRRRARPPTAEPATTGSAGRRRPRTRWSITLFARARKGGDDALAALVVAASLDDRASFGRVRDGLAAIAASSSPLADDARWLAPPPPPAPAVAPLARRRRRRLRRAPRRRRASCKSLAILGPFQDTGGGLMRREGPEAAGRALERREGALRVGRLRRRVAPGAARVGHGRAASRSTSTSTRAPRAAPTSPPASPCPRRSPPIVVHVGVDRRGAPRLGRRRRRGERGRAHAPRRSTGWRRASRRRPAITCSP